MAGQMVGNRGFVRPLPMADAEFEKVVARPHAQCTPTPCTSHAVHC